MNRILTEERIAVIEKGLFMALVSLCVYLFQRSRFQVRGGNHFQVRYGRIQANMVGSEAM